MKPKFEVADILRRYGNAFFKHNDIPKYKRKILHDIEKCRTAYFGGHITECPDCGHREASYNSCRNRHCPKCQGYHREKWIRSREADLLPVKYFHVVFTVPHRLNDLFLNHQVEMYNLLFTTAWSVIRTFGEDPCHLGAKTAMLSILHTWGQNLSYHPHLHCIVPAGGITDQGKWKESRSSGKFLFPVKAMSRVFRARLVSGIRQFVKDKKLNISQDFFNQLFKTGWVVYAKRPFKNVHTILEYLGRYTHKIAISNHRLKSISNDQITFSAKNYRKNGKKEDLPLSANEFLRRFCLHILPAKFRKVRHYGFLASRKKKEYLAAIRQDLGVQAEKTGQDKVTTEYSPVLCPYCHQEMVIIEIIVKERIIYSFYQPLTKPRYHQLE